MKHVGDITKLRGAELEVVDCITGGSPCQDLSVAGKRAGLSGERSGLFMEQIRIVKEMREHDRNSGRSGRFVRPRYMVWENVPGAFSSNKGRDFAAVLEEIVRIAEPEAPDVPVPEKGWPKSGMLYDMDGKWSVAWRVHDAQFWGVPQRRKRIALVADFGGLTAPEILFERKGLLGDFEQSEAEGKGAAQSVEGSIGGTVGIDVYNQEITGDVAASLTAACGGTNTSGQKALHFQERVGRPAVCYGRGAGVVNAIPIHDKATRYTGSCTGRDAYNDMLVAKALKAKANCDFREDSETYPITNNTVRRLTPLECERLQGYPDGWTDIGDWVDSKGKKHKAAESPRYKALGNSIALPFWKWIIKRISAQYERDATMGSLFDGIGGFPYCWERVNGKVSARWASEIEEFPMAVTKVRFGDR